MTMASIAKSSPAADDGDASLPRALHSLVMGLLRPDPLLVIGAPLTPAEIEGAIHLPPSHPDPCSILESLAPGSVLRHFDFVARYDRDSSFRPSEIEPLRRESDGLADQVVDVLGLANVKGKGRDALVAIEEYLREKEQGADSWTKEREDDPVWRLWEEMARDPPEGVHGYGSISDGKHDKRSTPLEPFGARGDSPPTLAEGQAVFWKYSAQIYSSLAHFSLAGGFSAPKLASVMRETNYLTSDMRDATHKRLLETSLFVLDAMTDMTTGSGRGWRSAFRVRMLHAQVRRRIANGKGRHNQDLLAVLGAFMVAPMWSLRRIGIKVTPREEAAYQVCWRHIGYYLGISPSLLLKVYGTTFEAAETYFASLAFCIFPSGATPSDPHATPQYKILSSIANRPPRPSTVQHHVELCRLFLGPSLADQLALPDSQWRERLAVDFEMWSAWTLLAFGQAYARIPLLGEWRGKSWEVRRQKWFRWAIELVVVFGLGERRTVFACGEADRHESKLQKDEGEEPGVEFGAHVGAAVRKEWRDLLLEMGVVCGSIAVAAVGCVVGIHPHPARLPSPSPPAMTAWRTSPSRPAPPISSDSPNHPTRDSLFAGPSHSHSPSTSRPSSCLSASGTIGSRTLTSSSSAYSLLARKKAEMDDEDDRMSVRSGLSSRGSSLTLSGKGEGTAKGRNRAASSASSVVTMRGSQGGVREDDDDRMEVDEQTTGPDEKGKGKAKDVAETASAKRQRLRPPMPDFTNPSTRPSRSYSTSPGNIVSPSQPTLSTTSADDLMPSMKRKPNRAPSISSVSSRPRPKTSTSSATLRPPSSPSKPPSIAPKDTSTSDSASLSTSPSETVSSAASIVSKRRSWFGNPADPPPPPVPPSAASSNDPPRVLAPSDPVPPADPAPAATLPASSVQPEANRGWLSLLSRGRPSMPDLAGAAAKQEVDDAETTPTQERPMELDVPQKEEEAREVEAEEAPATLTTNERGTEIAAAGSTNQPVSRLSWFGWSRATPSVPDAPSQKTGDEALAPEAPPPAPPAPEPLEEQTELPPSAEVTVATTSEQQTPAAFSEQRGWLSGWWGGAGQSAEELAAQRRRELWALKLASQRNANKLIEAVPEDEEMAPSSDERTATVTPATNDETPTPTPTPSQPLKHKPSGSWSIFSRTPASATSVPTGTSPTKSMLSLRAPLGGLGISPSSAASTRSRTSSHNAPDTAPSSPQLRAQSDQGPVKPLTGSIRSSPRQRPSSAFEAPPPVENLVLPTFNDTFLRPPRSFAPKKSTLTRAVSVVSSYFFHRPPTEESTSPRLVQAQQAAGFNPTGMLTEMRDDPAERLPKSLDVISEGPRLGKVKRVVTIGVHGWFTSNNMIKSLMGEQTGTSVKFATMMHDAVHSYLESHDVSSFNIQAIALEGQGEVDYRVNKLYSQLVGREEWLKAIKMADAVFVATHSQGSVVSTQLLARMLDQGLITGTQTHLLAMCGIAQGPFMYLYQSIALAPYFNYLESAPARELFAFQDAESVPAIKFIDSLRIILNAGVKLTVVGSLNDQVVPLYSALFSGVSHPAILRAVYIDSDAFRTSDFLANLIVFAIRLRNAGLSDHDLVYHVSEALAGALTGVGHSKIYEEEDVYKLAVRYHFETTHLTEPPTHLDTRTTPPPLSMSFNPRDRRNPYLLTWALRGIIEDPQVRELFSNELVALREAYETWKPQTKVLKDVKLKLEGIRMMSWRGGKL
ncbi:hypothetical protein OF846_001412 [Rhodotorula toruloides]|nr:hypothetical protein OF846_001412 [Rhodotorula toruloides]